MPPCLIGMEACVGAHHHSRKLQALGHHARLMPARYVHVVDAAEGKEKVEQSIITEHSPGIDLFLDLRAVTSNSSERIAQVLEAALAALRNAASPAAGPADLETTEAAGRA
jgi:hypothetical protein